MSDTSGAKVYDETERARIRATLTPEQLAYVETLEAIADVGWNAWKNSGLHTRWTNEQKAAFEDLYDALYTVGFMEKEE